MKTERLAVAFVTLLATACARAPAAPELTNIVFASNRDGDFDIYIAVADGSKTRRVNADNFVGDVDPTLSPRGDKVAFVRGGDIWVMGIDGSGELQLTVGWEFSDTEPSWSPDGSTIAYTRGYVGSSNSDIMVAYVDGSGGHRVTSTNNHSEQDPAWSPDGTTIIYASTEVPLGGPLQLYTVGSECVNCSPTYSASPYGEGFEPAYSPDGSQLAYTKAVEPGNTEIFVITFGVETNQITAHPGVDAQAAWSIDGSRIAFTTDRGVTAAASTDIWITDLEIYRAFPSITVSGDDQQPAWTQTNWLEEG